MDQRQNQEPEKRFACDRCHAQKLRCLRNDTNRPEGESCLRCQRANIQCIYSPSERLGRPPEKSKLRSRSQKSPVRRRRRVEVSKEASTMPVRAVDWNGTSSEFLYGTTNNDNIWEDAANLLETDQQNFQHDLDTSNAFGITHISEPEVGPGILATNGILVYNNDYDFFDSANLVNHDFEYQSSLLGLLEANCDQPPTLVDEKPQLQHFTQETSTNTGEDPKFKSDSPWNLMHVVTSVPPFQSLGSVMVDHPKLNNAKQTPCVAAAASNIKEEHMVQLLNMALILSKQLSIISSASAAKTSPSSPQKQKFAERSTTFDISQDPVTPIGETLRISQELIHILNIFKPISRSASPSAPGTQQGVPSPPLSSTQADRGIPYESCIDYDSEGGLKYISPSTLTSSHNENSTAHPDRSRQSLDATIQETSSAKRRKISGMRSDKSLKSENSSPSPANPPVLDIPIMLLILTCYIRLTQIYSVFFAHCIRVLTEYPSAADRDLLPAILPDVELGGFRPSNYGNLQISIVVETSMHMMARIKQCLVQPDDRNRSTDTSDTVLQLMDLVSREEGLGSLDGAATLEQLEKYTEIIKDLTRR